MNIRIIVAIIILILILGILVKNLKNNKIDNTEHADVINEMEKLFLEEVKNGEETCKLTHILNEFDFMFIKTIFLNEQIPYYMEVDNTLNIWPSMKLGTQGNVNLYILKKNYDDAMKIIEERHLSV